MTKQTLEQRQYEMRMRNKAIKRQMRKLAAHRGNLKRRGIQPLCPTTVKS